MADRVVERTETQTEAPRETVIVDRDAGRPREGLSAGAIVAIIIIALVLLLLIFGRGLFGGSGGGGGGGASVSAPTTGGQ